MELNIKDFDELEQYFKRKAQHVEELEQENTELTIEKRRLHQEIDRLKRAQVEYINQELNKHASECDIDFDKLYEIAERYILRKREQ